LNGLLTQHGVRITSITHTPKEPTPFCKDLGNYQETYQDDDVREKTITDRVALVRLLLAAGANHYAVYPKEQKTPRTDAELAIYQKSLVEFKGLINSPVEHPISGDISGASYIIQKDGARLFFSLNMKQADPKLGETQYTASLWFGPLYDAAGNLTERAQTIYDVLCTQNKVDIPEFGVSKEA